MSNRLASDIGTEQTGERRRLTARRLLRFSVYAALFSTIITVAVGGTLFATAARLGPPPLENAAELSTVVLDRHGRLLRPFATKEGRWRLPIEPENVDPRYIEMLLAYEDGRFYSHPGVDIWALLRASWQRISAGRIVSGASTLSMQVARLLENGESRSLKGKIVQIVRAFQLEWRLSKRDILALYLRLAPYGGNIEGVRAATLAYFGKEPRRLSPHEAALLVALPQSPELRRPDRFPKRAQRARDRVLKRMVKAGVLSKSDAARSMTYRVPDRRRRFLMLAAHLAEREVARSPETRRHRLTLDRTVQTSLERLARDHVRRLGAKLSAAVLVADHHSGEIYAHVGSAGYLDFDRFGAVDMTSAVRSPGSALKPFIYGLAFDRGRAHPETLIEDQPVHFGSYAPENFDSRYRGTVTLREALQLSLNVPAVKVLAAIGPDRLATRFRAAGLDVKVPRNLTIALGGIGFTLHDLTQLYATLARGGETIQLKHRRDTSPDPAASPANETKSESKRLFSPVTAWYVTDIMRGTRPPKNAKSGTIAYKTGTSYGHRDAWAVGFDGQYIVAVWVGRPDNTATSGLTGLTAAAPLLFDAFAHMGPRRAPLLMAPRAALRAKTSDLPLPLRHFNRQATAAGNDEAGARVLRIAFPPNKAELEAAIATDSVPEPILLKADGGHLPLTWLIDGRPHFGKPHRRTLLWRPGGKGFSELTVIDAKGRSDRVTVRIR